MNEQEAKTYALVQLHLEATVPLLIKELLKQGGPTEHNYACIRSYGRFLAEHGDALMFHKEGVVTSQVMDKPVAAVAVVAFCPGGIRVFGLTFDASTLAAQLGHDYSLCSASLTHQ